MLHCTALHFSTLHCTAMVFPWSWNSFLLAAGAQVIMNSYVVQSRTVQCSEVHQYYTLSYMTQENCYIEV